MSCLNSLDLRRGGKAAAINKSGFMDWAIRMAGDRSESALTTSAESMALDATSRTRCTAMLTSVSFSS